MDPQKLALAHQSRDFARSAYRDKKEKEKEKKKTNIVAQSALFENSFALLLNMGS